MTREELQTIFESEFNWNNWKKVMNFVFPEFKFNLVQTDLTRDTKAHKKSAGYIKEHGTTQLASPEVLTLCEIMVNDTVRLDRNIKSVRSLVADLVVPNYQTVIAVFHNADNTKWRFTLVVKEFTGSNRVFDKKPDSYTYVFGVGEKGRTASERFLKLAGNPKKTLKDLEEAFSVEALSKKFFMEYKAVYQKFVDDIIENPSRLEMFKGSDREKSARDFVKKMMGRLVFLYFLQKKGWLGCKTKWQGGDEQFMKAFVEKAKQDDLFYHHYLEPLFFDTLNDKRTKQNEDCIIQKTNFGKVPYLNGGLFEKDENHPAALTLKWENFKAFFDTLNNYNFTIIEDDPEFKEVAVDPEMLGHIFENLLEDNKDKGAFYTPKEIVHYMCQESLYEYLKTYLEQNNYWPTAESEATQLEKALHNFVTQKTAGKVIDFDKPLAKALKEVKICDPAIGSGAFPMGLLNEIFHCVHVLYDASPDTVGPVWDMDSWQPNKVKLNIIQNSIYGVDIEKGAVDIARLRFWLSLIVDEPEPTALPNLDYKIVVGNSLVSKLGDDIIDIDWNANDTSHGLFGADLAEKKKKLLQKISIEQKESFNPESDKKKLATDIRSLKIDLIINQLELMVKTQGIENKPNSQNKETGKQTLIYLQTKGWLNQINELRKLKIKSTEPFIFFDWKLDFPEIFNDHLTKKTGFDILIGNPPYIGEKGNEKIFQDVSKTNLGSRYYTRWMDYFYFFYHKGIDLLSEQGCLAFITTNYFYTSTGGVKLREDLQTRTSILGIVNFNELKIFESALGQHNCILTLKKIKQAGHTTKTIDTNRNGFADKVLLKSIFYGEDLETEYGNVIEKDLYEFDDYQIRLKSKKSADPNKKTITEVLQKMLIDAIPLSKITHITMGIVTLSDTVSGKHLLKYRLDAKKGDGIYVLTNDELDELKLSKEDKNKYVRPFYKNSDIKKYWCAESNKLWIIYLKDEGKPLALPTGLLMHFEKYKELITDLKRNFLKNEIAASVVKKWFANGNYFVLFTPKKEKYFLGPKIICPYRTKSNVFAYSESPWFASKDVGYILPLDGSYSLKYLLAILNSSLGFHWLYNKGKRKGNTLELYTKPLGNIPIRMAKKSIQDEFVSLVDQILNQRDNDIRESLLKEVDIKVFHLYGLSFEEALLFDSNLTRSEFDAFAT